ncbi:hypothetical protein GCM10022223_21680 [Kineosporia mesophila]|uniref:Uncharacterized protein n=1 Tax=Kineosporia mesophila TaxID=566012 RepID=A0ABP6ZGK9_9ACTN
MALSVRRECSEPGLDNWCGVRARGRHPILDGDGRKPERGSSSRTGPGRAATAATATDDAVADRLRARISGAPTIHVPSTPPRATDLRRRAGRPEVIVPLRTDFGVGRASSR